MSASRSNWRDERFLILSVVVIIIVTAQIKTLYITFLNNLGALYSQKTLAGSVYAADDAQHWLTLASELDVKNGAAYRFLGVLHLKLGNQEIAKNALRHAQALNAQDQISQIKLGEVFYRQGDIKAAIEIWYAAEAFQQLLVLGDELSSATQWQEAANAYQYAFNLTSTPSAAAYQRLAWAKWKATGNAEVSIDLLDKGISSWPDDIWLMIYKGRIYTDLQKLDEARIWYERAKSINPDVASVWFGLGKQALEEGNFTLAIEYYLTALEIKPDFAPGYYDLGLVYEHIGQFENALAAFQKAAQADPTKPWYHNSLARIYVVLNEFGIAVRVYKQTLEIDPGNNVALQGINRICRERSEIEGCKDAE